MRSGGEEIGHGACSRRSSSASRARTPRRPARPVAEPVMRRIDRPVAGRLLAVLDERERLIRRLAGGVVGLDLDLVGVEMRIALDTDLSGSKGQRCEIHAAVAGDCRPGVVLEDVVNADPEYGSRW